MAYNSKLSALLITGTYGQAQTAVMTKYRPSCATLYHSCLCGMFPIRYVPILTRQVKDK